MKHSLKTLIDNGIITKTGTVKKEYLDSDIIKELQLDGVISSKGKVSKRYYINNKEFTDVIHRYSLNPKTKKFEEDDVIFRWERDAGQRATSSHDSWGVIAYTNGSGLDSKYYVDLPADGEYYVSHNIYNSKLMQFNIFTFTLLSEDTLNAELKEKIIDRLDTLNNIIQYKIECINRRKSEINEIKSDVKFFKSFIK